MSGHVKILGGGRQERERAHEGERECACVTVGGGDLELLLDRGSSLLMNHRQRQRWYNGARGDEVAPGAAFEECLHGVLHLGHSIKAMALCSCKRFCNHREVNEAARPQ